MGLDMYLNSIPKIEDYSFGEMMVFSNLMHEGEDLLPEKVREKVFTNHSYGMDWRTLHNEVGYWRKANHIHNWFVENVQGGEDECEPHQVTKEQIQDLLEDVNKVLKSRDDNQAKELLPTVSGSFFGSAEFDEYYYDSLQETRKILEKTLNSVNFEKNYVYYESSW